MTYIDHKIEIVKLQIDILNSKAKRIPEDRSLTLAQGKWWAGKRPAGRQPYFGPAVSADIGLRKSVFRSRTGVPPVISAHKIRSWT